MVTWTVRVWMDGFNLVAAYDDSVFDKPQANPDALVIYTEKNSGYFSPSRLRIGPDERLWSLDSSGEALVWIDPDVDNLEEPLPDWVNQVFNSFWITLGLPLVAVGFFILGGIVLQNEGYFKRKK